MSVFSVTQPAEVRVEIQSGRVNIVATDRPDVLVTTCPSNADRPGDRSAAAQVRVDQTSGVLRVTGPHRLNLFGAGDSLDVLVEVPVPTCVFADLKYGSMHVTGELADCQLKVAYGDLTVDRATRLEVSAGHGDVRVDRVTGDADVRLKSGSLRLGRVAGALRLNGGNAAVGLDSVGATAELVTSSGAIEIGHADADLSIRSSYGIVRINDLVRGYARIDGSYGAIDVGVRHGTAVWLDAVTQYGVVRTDLNSDDGPNSHDERLELQIRSGYGDITVHRAIRPARPPG